jgi:GDPmannose 4,6-dehydratase
VIFWEGNGVNEVGKNSKTGNTLIKVDPGYFRPTEVDFILGDSSKARLKLEWEPSITFEELVKMMVREDLKEAERDQFCRNEGFRTFNGYE